MKIPSLRKGLILLILFILPFHYLFANTGKKNRDKLISQPSSPTTGVSKLSIQLYQASGEVVGTEADGVLARYNNIYLESPFEAYDAPKLNNFNENLSLVRNGRYLSIESRPFPTRQDTLYLSCWGLKNQDYAFTITSSQFTGLNQVAILVDAFTNKQILLDLSDGTVTYPFTITADAGSNSLTRFKIIMTPVTVLPVTFTKMNAVLVADKAQISWCTGSALNVKSYAVERSADGINFSKVAEIAAVNVASPASYQWTDNQPLRGINYYRIQSNEAGGKYAFSIIASLQLNGKLGMQVMPTIISNRRFNLLLNDEPSGNYQLFITNSAGQQVYQKKFSNTGGQSTQVIELGNAPLPNGVYNLSVSGLNKSYQNFRILIAE